MGLKILDFRFWIFDLIHEWIEMVGFRFLNAFHSFIETSLHHASFENPKSKIENFQLVILRTVR